ncbi:MAG: L-glyceraldehyde 3-phosphate reductase [Halanaerobiaceae bacterium]|jgi:L-glyceraldehyde 3-phosphate reductase|nr:L-glyceraldehyde 3-phosphate reductase [Halanaerobiaceae bacterium]
MKYVAAADRYERMTYRACGNSGLKLPGISLGLWHNFGGVDSFEKGREIVLKAFDLGITHFDLANNYGPPPGSAEETMGKILKKDLKAYRDELIISSKAGYGMWPGPYGDGGSRKYLIASLDQSLKRMGLDYVDIFYHHRPDPDTALEETMGALDSIVRQGKALYVGLSNYNSEQGRKAIKILKELGTPCLVFQPSYSMLNRWIETDGLLDMLEEEGVGTIVYSPLAQGLLSSKYLKGIPRDSRAAKAGSFLRKDQITEEKLSIIQELNQLAADRGQTLSQMALAWVLRGRVTSALVGASKASQIEENVKALEQPEFSDEELKKIDDILNKV